MDDFKAAIEGIMALRPSNSSSSNKEKTPPSCIMQRRRDLDFKREMASINDGEPISAGAFFFSNMDKSKGGNKNPSFNVYSGKIK